MTGYLLNERLGKVVFFLVFVGFNLTFWPMHVLGLRGMQRRIADYPASLGPGASLTTPNLVATIGSYVMTIGALLFLWNVFQAFRRKVPAGNDPWGGYTLEWYTTSPPPKHNFHDLPPIRSERPVFDWRHRGDPKVEEPTRV
jgi:heme/copper-type cytochrome/quinol oxidase subunit 1